MPMPAPGAVKRPRVESPGDQRATPAWTLSTIDFHGPWCPTSMDCSTLEHVVGKLGEFESMTWAEIEGRNSHAVAVESVGKAARDRLSELRLDDVDELFSLRLQGAQRVWGIREGRVLKLLWWDPEHKVYPVRKKHT